MIASEVRPLTRPLRLTTDFSLIIFLVGFSFAIVNVIVMALGYVGRSYDSLGEYALLASGPLLMYLSVAAALGSGRMREFAPFYRLWVRSVIGLLVLLLALGLVRVIVSSEGNAFRAMANDFLMWSYFISGILVGVKSANWRHIDRWLTFWFAIVTVIAIYGWFTLGLATQVASRSNVTWTMPYIIWLLLFAWPYLLLSLNERGFRRKLVIIVGCSIYAVLALAFEKRLSIGQLIMLPAVLALLAVTVQFGAFRLSSLARVGILITLLTVGVIATVSVLDIGERSGDLVQQTSTRFLGEGGILDTTLTNERLTEDPQTLVSELSDLELLIGRGLGGVMTEVTGRGGVSGIVHNGLVTVALKGGFVFVLLWLVGWSRLVWDAFRNSQPALNRYYIPVVIIAALSLSFGTFIGLHPGFAFVGLIVGRCMSRRPAAETSHR